jgi:hypothetical protein
MTTQPDSSIQRPLPGPPGPEELTIAWQRRKLVLFLGAGVSLPYGLPSWSDLVLSLLLDESSRAFAEFWPHYRAPLASWLAETFGINPVGMARVVRAYSEQQNLKGAAFSEYVRDMLYRSVTTPNGPTALSAIADLLARSEGGDRWHIPVVVTFNFDDLLETQLRQRARCLIPTYDGCLTRVVRETEEHLTSC